MLSKKGFTLLEIMIVILILGVIAAIAIPQLMDKKENVNPLQVTQEQGSIEINPEGKFWKQLDLVSNKQYRIILRQINDNEYTFIIKEVD